MSNAFIPALLAACGNVIGALAVTRRASASLRAIEQFLAFGAGFMLAVVLIEVLPAAFQQSGPSAPLLVFAGYFAVHLSQHTLTPHFHFGEETHHVSGIAARSALLGLLLHTFFDGVAIAGAFLVRPQLGVVVAIAIFLHKLPEGVTIASLTLAAGGDAARALRASMWLGVATLLGVLVTNRVGFLVHNGLALAAGVTLYVAASNLVPEFQGKRGWKLPASFFGGATAFFLTKLLLDAAAP